MATMVACSPNESQSSTSAAGSFDANSSTNLPSDERERNGVAHYQPGGQRAGTSGQSQTIQESDASIALKNRIYERKCELLTSKYDAVYKSNNKLRNRLYHIKKEVKYLKRLKRDLMKRLVQNEDRFMDSTLEIPDNEPGSSVEDQIIAQVAQSVADSVREEHERAQQLLIQQAVSPSPPPPPAPLPPPVQLPPLLTKAESRRRSEAMLKSLSEDAKASVFDIIQSVIRESREERDLQRQLELAEEDPDQPCCSKTLSFQSHPDPSPSSLNYTEQNMSIGASHDIDIDQLLASHDFNEPEDCNIEQFLNTDLLSQPEEQMSMKEDFEDDENEEVKFEDIIMMQDDERSRGSGSQKGN